MAVYKEISSKAIIRKVMRDLKPNHANWIDDAVEWIGEALEHIGASSQLRQKQCVLDIVDHKALLPHDLYFINQVAVNNSVAPAASTELDVLTKQVRDLKAVVAEYNRNVEDVVQKSEDGTFTSTLTATDLETYDTQYKSNVLELRELTSRIVVLEGIYFGDGAALEPLSYGASTFHASMHCEGCSNEFSRHKDSYIIDNDYIKTSFETGKVCISYQAFPTDEDCFPLVPDDISYREAMFWYIFKQMLLGGFSKPTLNMDYNFADQKWRYYCTQARNAANYPDIDRYESYMNQWVRLVPDLNRHQMFFEQLNDRENLFRGYTRS
jgi:hypothetical protein|tara:strand:- start:1485 stop:2456 length:972 start_codon:yes stop_codon:yes gene_type:complete